MQTEGHSISASEKMHAQHQLMVTLHDVFMDFILDTFLLFQLFVNIILPAG